jgi:hypothetical protein
MPWGASHAQRQQACAQAFGQPIYALPPLGTSPRCRLVVLSLLLRARFDIMPHL